MKITMMIDAGMVRVDVDMSHLCGKSVYSSLKGVNDLSYVSDFILTQFTPA